MSDQEILDAPEQEEVALKVPVKSILLSLLLFPISYSLLFLLDDTVFLSTHRFELWKFDFDLSKLFFVIINCFGLYIFTSFIKFELRHWFRIMTISISIVLFSTLIVFVFFALVGGLPDLFDLFKRIAFISLIVGGGCSLAVQFLHKKHYLIFSAMMIATIAIFSLIENL